MAGRGLVTAVACALAGVITGAAPLGTLSRQRPAQTPSTPTFRAAANYVEIDAIVTDKSGQFVRGLTRDDFEITEDKTPQDVAAFSVVDLPMNVAGPTKSAAPPRAPSDVASNAVEGRVYMIVLDYFNLPPEETPRVQRVLRQFILNYLGPNDLAAVVHLGHFSKGFEFTSDKQRLLALVNALGEQPNADQLAADATPVQTGGRGDSDFGDALAGMVSASELFAADDAQRAAQTLAIAAQYLAGLRGRRKSIVLFSGGSATDVHQAVPNTNVTAEIAAAQVLGAEREMISAATRANVNISPIDPRGLSAIDAFASFNFAAPRPDQIQWESLRTIANETGGRALLGTNKFDELFQQFVQDNSAYYVLGYYSPNAKQDGQFHAISVKVRRPGLEVSARKGYYAASSKDSKMVAAMADAWAKTDLGSLLARSLPTGDLGLEMRASAAAVKHVGSNAAVALTLEVNGRGLSFENRNRVFADDVEVAYSAISDDGKALTKHSEQTALRLQPATHDAVVAHGWRYQTQVELAPGHYQLRVAAREQPAGHAGSVFLDIDVPDFSKPALVMAGLVLSAMTARVVPTAGTVPALAGILPGPPTTAREFSVGDTLAVFARISENNPSRPHTIDITTTVRAADGKEMFKVGKPHDAGEVGADAPGYLALIPLGRLPAGAYTLTVSTTSSIDTYVVSRDVPFQIR